MVAKSGVCVTGAAKIAMVVIVAVFCIEAYGWSVSGIVKSSSGDALGGVSVTVMDSSQYSATTDADGKFTLQSPTVSVIPDRLNSRRTDLSSVRTVGNELLIKTSLAGSFDLSLMDCLGRTIWSATAVAAKGVMRCQLPDKLGGSVVFLRISHAGREEYHTMISTSEGLRIVPSRVSMEIRGTKSASTTSCPTLIFRKADYLDTTFLMTSVDMTNISVTMTPVGETCDLPTGTLKWQSSGILVNIKPNTGHAIVSVKDPTIQKYNDKYLIYCTVYNTSVSTWSMQFIKFSDFSQADAETPFFMDQVSGFSGYKCAPELFYMESQDLWYLIWQQQDPAYSTTTTPDNPSSWSSPKTFYSGSMPKPANWGSKNWLPIDYWPIADSENFYIFFTGDDGNVFRIKTSLASFPNGFGTPIIVKNLGTDVIFEGSSHYKVKGTANTYLHLVEGMGSTGRYYSAWTSEGIEGTWTDYKVGQSNPFARSNNVTYEPSVSDWTDDVSHGELLRSNPNQTQEVDPCNLQFLYQGKAPGSSGSYELLPYRLGLITLQ